MMSWVVCQSLLLASCNAYGTFQSSQKRSTTYKNSRDVYQSKHHLVQTIQDQLRGLQLQLYSYMFLRLVRCRGGFHYKYRVSMRFFDWLRYGQGHGRNQYIIISMQILSLCILGKLAIKGILIMGFLDLVIGVRS